MKRILICGMLLALATSLSFAQRSRGVGPSTGVGPAVGHVGPAARMPDTGPMSPTTRVSPNTLGTDRAPNHVSTTSPDTTSVGPATGDRVGPDARTTGADTGKSTTPATVPDRTVMPDANGVSDHTRINPNQ